MRLKRAWILAAAARFLGGFEADTGLTGRKLMVDTYGGLAAQGGGALCGKDPTKVDRSSAYMARYIAKNIVAAGLASKCQLELAYAIGVAQPVSVLVDTYGTGKLSDGSSVQTTGPLMYFEDQLKELRDKNVSILCL